MRCLVLAFCALTATRTNTAQADTPGSRGNGSEEQSGCQRCLAECRRANQVTLEVRSAFFPTVVGNVTGVGALSGSSLSAGGY